MMNNIKDIVDVDEMISSRRGGGIIVDELTDNGRGDGDPRTNQHPSDTNITTAVNDMTSTGLDHTTMDTAEDEKRRPKTKDPPGEKAPALGGSCEQNTTTDTDDTFPECGPCLWMERDSQDNPQEKSPGRQMTTENTFFTRPLIPIVGAIHASGSGHKILGESKTKRTLAGTPDQHGIGRDDVLANLSSTPSPPLRPNVTIPTKAGLRRSQEIVSPSVTQPSIADTTKAGLRRSQASSSSVAHNVTASQATSKAGLRRPTLNAHLAGRTHNGISSSQPALGISSDSLENCELGSVWVPLPQPSDTEQPILAELPIVMLERDRQEPSNLANFSGDDKPSPVEIKLVVATPIVEPSRRNMQEAVEIHEDLDATKNRRRKDRFRTVGIVGLVIIAVVAVVLGVVFGRSRPDNKEESVATPSPTLTPTTSRRSYLRSLLPGMSIQAVDADEYSPQSIAFQWLEKDPAFESFSEDRILQRFALATLFHSTNGNNWTDNTNWMSYDISECQWYPWNQNAVPNQYLLVNEKFPDFNANNTLTTKPLPENGCDVATFRHLWLTSNNLDGFIPEELYLLTSLRSVFFREDEGLQGTISTQICTLGDIETFVLENVTVSGSLPSEVGLLSNLQMLNVDITLVNGTIPSEVGHLHGLEDLWLTSSSLSGSVPSELAGLKSLKSLYLYGNVLDGSLPTEVGKITTIEIFGLYGNNLTGSLPTELGLLTSMQRLTLDTNQLTGSIPSELGVLSSLLRLYLYENILTGSLPTELGLVTSMQDLELFANQLTGSIPSELGLLSSMSLLYLDENMLTGPLPTELGLLTSMQDLDLFANQLTGSIPSELGVLSSMSSLFLHENRLTGFLPTELGLLTSMQYLALYVNQLTGRIPSELGLLSSMSLLYLHENLLTGSLPTELGLLTSMQDLAIYVNQLTGTIPSDLGVLSSMQGLYLDENKLTGSIPSELGQLTSMTALHLYKNMLSDALPTEIGLLGSMSDLRLHDNQLTGRIPSEFGMLSGLSSLSLGNNSLTGKIPAELSLLLRNPVFDELDLEGNFLLGTVPSELCSLVTFNQSAQSGLLFDCNAALCGCWCVCLHLNGEP